MKVILNFTLVEGAFHHGRFLDTSTLMLWLVTESGQSPQHLRLLHPFHEASSSAGQDPAMRHF